MSENESSAPTCVRGENDRPLPGRAAWFMPLEAGSLQGVPSEYSGGSPGRPASPQHLLAEPGYSPPYTFLSWQRGNSTSCIPSLVLLFPGMSSVCRGFSLLLCRLLPANPGSLLICTPGSSLMVKCGSTATFGGPEACWGHVRGTWGLNMEVH